MFRAIKTTGLATLSGGLLLAATATSSEAYNCRVPAVRDVVKRTVCGAPELRTKDTAEQAELTKLRSWLNRNAYNITEDDRKQFTATRKKCQKDVRCLDATYDAQLRLYTTLLACKAGPRQTACVKNAIQKHRQELHKSA
jgi:uncharacterized protein